MAIDNSGLVYLLDPFWQGENLNGKPLVGGYMCVYVAGTDTKYITYQDFDGTRNPFKIPLGSDGRAVIIVEAQYKYDCYLYDSFGNMVCSRLNVSPDVGGDVSVSGLTEVYHDGTLEGEGTPWVPLTVSTSAIDEMVSGKADVSALTAYQEISGMTAYQPAGDYYSASNPSGFATTDYVDSGLSGKVDTSALDGLMSASLLESTGGVITAYNGSAFAGGGSTYSGIDPVIVDNENKTISVSAKEFVVNDPLQLVENQSAFELSLTANLDSPRTRIVEYGVDDWDAVESAISDMSAGKIDYVVAKMVEGNDVIYAPLARVNSGEQAIFVSPANAQDAPYGMGTRNVTDVISISTGGSWFDRMIRPFQGKLYGYGSVHVQATGSDYEISGDTLPTSAQEAIDLVSTNSATWDTVSSKQPSGDYYSASNPSGFITGVPTGTMNESGLEYSGSTITGYNGSAFVDSFTGISHDGSFVGDGKTTPIQLSDDVTISGLLPELTISAAGRATGYYKPEMVKMHATGSGGDQMGQYGAEGINLTYNGGKYYHTELKTTAGGINIRYLGNTAISADYMNSGLSFTDMTGTESAGARDIARWNSTYNTVSTNSASWTGGGAGGDVYVSGFEYTTGGDISGYSGSAFVGNEETFEISAGYGISLTTGADSLTISNTLTLETGSI